MEIRDGEDNGTVLGLISAACVAGAYREAIRLQPELAGGWGRKADQWSSRVTALTEQIREPGIGVPAHAKGVTPDPG